MTPIEPPASPWVLPDPHTEEGPAELLGIGADLEPGTMLAAYRAGLFPMDVDLQTDEPALGWWSPQPRGVLIPGTFALTRSLRRTSKRFTVTIDQSFHEVVAACADPARPHGWISDDFIDAYSRLFDLGWAHSVEVWSEESGCDVLAGGLFGIELGGLFAAESMFHTRTDASKVAVRALSDILGDAPGAAARIIDTQWLTPHLESLGAVERSREDYLRSLPAALALPPALAAAPVPVFTR